MATARQGVRQGAARGAALLALCAAAPARASLFQGETLDMVADYASWLVLIVAPIVGIAIFWIVHILPEKIAEKKHHPQAKAIQALCLLSLVFGGLLWPLAMLWAVSKPVLHKAAYGTDRVHPHEPEPEALPQPQPALAPLALSHQEELFRIRAQLDAFATLATPPTPEQVQDLRARLAVIEAATIPTIST